MKFPFGLFIFIILSLLLMACQKEKSGITGFEEQIETNYFPNTIGTKWFYFYYDSLTNYSDTVIVQVVGDTIFDGNRKARIWEYRFRTSTERKYVVISGDTVVIGNNLNNTWANTKYILPFEVGNKWAGDFYSDSNYVIEKVPVTVMAGHFPESYLIKEFWGVVNDYGLIYSWFVPGVGIVKKHHLGWSFGMANIYWELMDYHIKSP